MPFLYSSFVRFLGLLSRIVLLKLSHIILWGNSFQSAHSVRVVCVTSLHLCVHSVVNRFSCYLEKGGDNFSSQVESRTSIAE